MPDKPNTSDKPVAKTKRFNADAIELEDKKGPFPFTVNGHDYELRDPREVDYQMLLAARAGDQMQLIQGALPEAQVHRFFREKIEAHRFDAICRAYMEHADLGNSPASPTS